MEKQNLKQLNSLIIGDRLIVRRTKEVVEVESKWVNSKDVHLGYNFKGFTIKLDGMKKFFETNDGLMVVGNA